MTTNGVSGFDVISTYSREQAFEDGVLVDMSQPGPALDATKRVGIKYPVALTAGCYAATVGNPDDPTETERERCERYQALLRAMREAIKKSRGVYRVDFETGGINGEQVTLYALCGPGDGQEPVITVMLPWED
ncbi:MAG: hypothetical protein M0P55_14540 [Clostridiales bacterium]|nr:hypothetical protein [Clostridiales bacterium]